MFEDKCAVWILLGFKYGRLVPNYWPLLIFSLLGSIKWRQLPFQSWHLSKLPTDAWLFEGLCPQPDSKMTRVQSLDYIRLISCPLQWRGFDSIICSFEDTSVLESNTTRSGFITWSLYLVFKRCSATLEISLGFGGSHQELSGQSTYLEKIALATVSHWLIGNGSLILLHREGSFLSSHTFRHIRCLRYLTSQF